MRARQVLTGEYTLTEEPLYTAEVDGLDEAIERIGKAEEGVEIVEHEDRTATYKVYWNSATETVRVGAIYMLASYEVPEGEW